MKSKSIFAIVGMVVVGILLLILMYFAWIGWNERGKPVPELNVSTQPAD